MCDIVGPMRTTLDIDDDVLAVAKQLARQKGSTAGQVISSLVRQALLPKKAPKVRNGVPLFQTVAGARKPSLELVNRLRDAG